MNDGARIHARLGWCGLFVWAALGLVLEALHGWKVPSFVDDELAHTLLRLAHAHGVALSALLILATLRESPLGGDATGHVVLGRRALGLAWVLLPVGFLLGALDHPEGDPAIGIVLAPIGGVSLLVGLAIAARESFRR